MHLSVQLAPVADTVVTLTLTGELDATTVPVLSATLEPLPVTRVVVAAGELWFCDLSGLGRLVTARRDLRAEGGELVLAEPGRALRRLVSLLGGHRPPLPMFDTLPEALAVFGVREKPPGRRHLPLLCGFPVTPAAGPIRRRDARP